MLAKFHEKNKWYLREGDLSFRESHGYGFGRQGELVRALHFSHLSQSLIQGYNFRNS